MPHFWQECTYDGSARPCALVLACSGRAEERVSRVSPRTAVPRSRSAIARRRTRLLASGALGVVLVALAWLVLGSGGSREYRVIMQNAGQLVPGDIVRIGGVQAGSVQGLDLTPDGQAVVTISLDDGWGKLHAGTTVTVRAS